MKLNLVLLYFVKDYPLFVLGHVVWSDLIKFCTVQVLICISYLSLHIICVNNPSFGNSYYT